MANLKPGDYWIIAGSVRSGVTRYSALTDSQSVTITKSERAGRSIGCVRGFECRDDGVAVGKSGRCDPAVRVTGPQGFSQTIAATTTFDGIEPGIYFIVAPEIVSNQQRFAANRTSQQVQLSPGLNGTNVTITYAQITGNLTFAINGLPAGVNADIGVTGPVASYVVGSSGDLVGVRSGQYTVTAKQVVSGTSLYVPNFSSQTVTLAAGGSVVVSVNYTSSDGPLNLTVDGVTITQVVQNYAGTVPLIAGRDAFVRVFAKANQQTSASAQVRVRVYNGETLVTTLTPIKGPGVPIAVRSVIAGVVVERHSPGTIHQAGAPHSRQCRSRECHSGRERDRQQLPGVRNASDDQRAGRCTAPPNVRADHPAVRQGARRQRLQCQQGAVPRRRTPHAPAAADRGRGARAVHDVRLARADVERRQSGVVAHAERE